jgi:hypothetical protein
VAVIVPPPQVPVSPLGVEIISPAGNVSANPMPERLCVVLLFWIVKLSDVDPFRGTLAAPNTLLSTGGAVTVRLAFEVFPVPPSVEVTCTLLFFTPAVAPCTFNETVQEALAARVPPDRLAAPAPATAVAVPPHVLLRPGVDATANPAGKVSVNATFVRATLVFGFVMLKVNVVVPFRETLAAPNAFVIAGALATVRFAEAVLPVPPLVALTLPVVFVNWPDAVAVTFTVIVQVLLEAAVPPVNETLPDPAVAVAVPPQVLVNPLGVATTIPAGNVSVNATPVSATALAAGFVIVKVSEVIPFRTTVVGLNALAIDGGATTLMDAEAVPPVPPSVEVTAPVVLFFVPAVASVTFTENVHELLCARVAPVRLIAPVPCVAAIVPAPQVPAWPLGVEMTNPAGSVSVKLIPDRL